MDSTSSPASFPRSLEGFFGSSGMADPSMGEVLRTRVRQKLGSEYQWVIAPPNRYEPPK